MPTLRRLLVENGYLYKDASLRFDTGKLVVVYGKNLSTKRAQSNGAGKSLFFGYFADLMYNSLPLATTKVRGKNKELYGKNTRVYAEIENAGIEYRVEKTAKGIGISYLDDSGSWVDEEPRTTAISMAYIRRYIWPMSESDFYTTCFLKPRRFSVLLDPNDANRRWFFEQLFKLNAYQLMHEEFKAELRRLDELWVKRESLATMVKSLTVADWAGGSFEDIQASASLWQERLTTVNSELTTAFDLHSKLSAYLAVCSNLPDQPTGLIICQEELARLKALDDQYQAKVRAQVESDRLFPEFEEVRDKRRQVAADLENFTLAGQSVDELIASIREYNKARQYSDKLTLEVEQLTAQVQEYLLLADGSQNPYCKMSRDDLQRQAVFHQITLEAYQAASKAVSSCCVLCGSDVDTSTLASRAASSQAILEQTSWALTCHDLADKLEVKVGQLEEIILQEPKHTEEEVRAYSTLLNQKVSLDLRFKSLKDALSPHLKVLEESEHIEDVGAALEQARESLAAAQSAERQLDTFDRYSAALSAIKPLAWTFWTKPNNPDRAWEVPLAEVEGYIVELQSRQVRAQEGLTLAQAELNRYTAWNEANEANAETVKQATEAIDAIDEEMANYYVVETLCKAYSNKGIKLVKLTELMELMAQKLNEFRPLLFGEPFTFQNVVAEGKCQLLVTRPDGVTSDVHDLSDSEAMKYLMLVCVAHIVMLPAKTRANMLILDEMSSYGDDITKESYLKDFIPMLQQLVPNLFVISPTDLDLEGATVVTAVKRKGVTELECSDQDLIGR